MGTYSQDAEFFRLGLITGCVTIDEIKIWADRHIANAINPDIRLIELSLVDKPKDILSMLRVLSQGADHHDALRKILGKMSQLLKKDKSLARNFVAGLEQIVIENSYSLPDDLMFINGLDDEFSLAEQGIYESVEKQTGNFMKALELFERHG